jgi:hypothetical protein
MTASGREQPHDSTRRCHKMAAIADLHTKFVWALRDQIEILGFEFGIVHTSTIARVACGALVGISYSVGGRGRLYKQSYLQS